MVRRGVQIPPELFKFINVGEQNEFETNAEDSYRWFFLIEGWGKKTWKKESM